MSQFEYYSITIEDDGTYWKHTSVVDFDCQTCEVGYEIKEPEQITWNELNEYIDKILDEADEL